MRELMFISIVFVVFTLIGCKSTGTKDKSTHVTSETTNEITTQVTTVITTSAITTEPIVEEKTVFVNNSAELTNALKKALPGHQIVLKSGETFVGNKSISGDSRAYFYGFENGTEAFPIILESEDPNNPAILKGLDVTNGYTLYITGDYWKIKNVKVEHGQKGIMLDNSNNTLIYGCEVYNIGHEAIHLRDGSSNNIIDHNNIHDTGLFYAGYGEGIYVGSDKGKWNDFDRNANDNIIKNNTLGPNVAAEHIDIKEGTLGTIIENNTFNGTGISGVHYADSFIDAKGNKAIIRNNVFHQNDNSLIVDAIQVSTQISGWGFQNEVNDNTIYIDSYAYIVNVFGGSVKAQNNTREPMGNMYKGNVTVLN
ncbi:MAG: hypothetical protein K0Q49_590 [Haloplasmataceae bacterium]|jgi:parallel beta-helix repeat protein|nr:hypothetical protein [Haloplasmataceae bacterium]